MTVDFTTEQLKAYDDLGKVRNGYYNVQAHPGTGKATFLVSGIKDNMFKFK